MLRKLPFCLSCAGFDSDKSLGGLSEANPRVTAVVHTGSSTCNGAGKAGERPPQENGVQKHRYVVPHAAPGSQHARAPSAPSRVAPGDQAVPVCSPRLAVDRVLCSEDRCGSPF